MQEITVQSTNGRTFWERNEAHPDGEAFVAGDTAVKVAKTAQVEQAIKNGRLRIVEVTARKRAGKPRRKKTPAKGDE